MAKSAELTYREKLGHIKYLDPGIDCSQDPPITQQSGKDECDINKIIEKATRGQIINHVNALPAKYGDFSNVPDFQTALNLVQEAQEAFSQLTTDVKKRFNQNPQELMDFLQDPKNDEEARKLGLVNPLPEIKSVDDAIKPVAKSEGAAKIT